MCNRAGANRIARRTGRDRAFALGERTGITARFGLCTEKRAVPSAVLATASSCALFTASVACVPAATLTIWRSLPLVPTATVLARLEPE